MIADGSCMIVISPIRVHARTPRVIEPRWGGSVNGLREDGAAGAAGVVGGDGDGVAHAIPWQVRDLD